MLKQSIKKVLDKFGKDVATKSKSNLSKLGMSGDLSNSISYKTTGSGGDVNLTFTMLDYWKYVDYGVSGVGGTKADGSSWNTKKVSNNKFKYTTKKPPASAFSEYSSDKSSQFAIATSVFHTGIKTTGFFTRPFNDEVIELEKELSNVIPNAIALEIESNISSNSSITITIT